jgi:predicted nucleotidyltransferase
MELTPTLLNEIVSRIVEHAHPERILLFGSYARGVAHEGSDLDLLVVVSETTPRRECSVRLYRALAGIGVSKDIVVVHPSDIERLTGVPGTIVAPAVAEGKVLYDAAA